MLYVVPRLAFFVSLLPFIKVLGQIYQVQQDFLQNCNARNLFSYTKTFAMKLSKIGLWKKIDFWVLTNHTAVHGGVRRR